MATEIKVPTLGESVTEATVSKWFKAVGEAVEADALLELETDKVTMEVNAPAAGVLAEILAEEGAEVEVGALLGTLSEGSGCRAGAERGIGAGRRGRSGRSCRRSGDRRGCAAIGRERCGRFHFRLDEKSGRRGCRR